MLIWILKVLVIVLAIGAVGLYISALVFSVRKDYMKEELKLFKQVLIPEIEGMVNRMTRNSVKAMMDTMKDSEKDENIDFN